MLKLMRDVWLDTGEQDDAETTPPTNGSCLGQIVVCAKLNCSIENITNSTNATVSENDMIPEGDGASTVLSNSLNGTTNSTQIRSQTADKKDVPPIVVYANTSSCRTGYAGALCGACDIGWVMTKDGCISCAADSMFEVVVFVAALAALVFAMYKLIMYLKRKLKEAKDDDTESSSDEEDEGNDTRDRSKTLRLDHETTSKERIAAGKRKMRLVKHLAGFKLSLEMQNAAKAIGSEELKQAQADAKTILSVMKKGAGRSKTSIKIAVGLTQILGEMPSVLDLKYPEGFLGFIDSLAFIQFDIFQIFKVDCLATTDIYTKFLATMSLPVILVVAVEIRMHVKVRSLRSAVWHNNGKAWKGDPIVSLHEKHVRKFRANVYQDSKNVQKQEKLNQRAKGMLFNNVVMARAASLADNFNWDDAGGGARCRTLMQSKEEQHAHNLQLQQWKQERNQRQEIWRCSEEVQRKHVALKQAGKDVLTTLGGLKHASAMERQDDARYNVLKSRADALIEDGSWRADLQGTERVTFAKDVVERDLKREEIAMSTADADLTREGETKRRHLALFKKKFEPKRAKLIADTAGLKYAVVFFLYPMLSRTVFRIWLCRELDYGERWHVDQYAIDCNAPKHKLFELIAFVFALLYPIGIPLYFFVAMWKVRQHLVGEDKVEVINQICQTDPEITEYTGDVFQDVSRTATEAGQQILEEISRHIEQLRARLSGADEDNVAVAQMREQSGGTSKQQIEERQFRLRARQRAEELRKREPSYAYKGRAYRKRREAVHGRAENIDVAADEFLLDVDDDIYESDAPKQLHHGDMEMPGTPSQSPSVSVHPPVKVPCDSAGSVVASRATQIGDNVATPVGCPQLTSAPDSVREAKWDAIDAQFESSSDSDVARTDEGSTVANTTSMSSVEISKLVDTLMDETSPDDDATDRGSSVRTAPAQPPRTAVPPATPRIADASPHFVNATASPMRPPFQRLQGGTERELTVDDNEFAAMERTVADEEFVAHDGREEGHHEQLGLSRRLQGGKTEAEISSDEDDNPRGAVGQFAEDVCYHCKQPGHWKIHCPMLQGKAQVQMKVQNGRAVRVFKFDPSAVSDEIEIIPAEPAKGSSVRHTTLYCSSNRAISLIMRMVAFTRKHCIRSVLCLV
jgi:hypothetical protein